ncbi:ArsR/SmtB family transcription factor [Salinirubellus sp. GCM10025818]|jgi:DNA-binding transcriptional ArsR family regulator|uniref:ArsR/SmtB family transcription factor n=1 Tax=Salinirubellus TaxID=2162630 RepID=UPI0030D4E0A9
MSFAERDVEIERELALDTETAAAVGNDLRARILARLAGESGTIESLTEDLRAAGEERAEPTVRHHVRKLESAGLVEVERLESVGGGTRKHYRANTRLLPYSLPEGATGELAAARTTTRRGAKALVDAVLENHGPEIRAVADELEGTEIEGAADERERVAFVLRALVDRALTDLAEAGRFEADSTE